jgi:hypothetical protein
MNDISFNTGVIKPVECVKEGWELIKNDYWVLFAVALVGALIGGFSMYILLGAMFCGIFYCYLRAIDGKPVSFDGLWKGFEYFKPSLIVTLLIVIPTLIVYAIMYIPFVAAMAMGTNLSEGEFITLLVGVAAVDFVIIIIMVCFHTLLMFSFPLIVDRNLSAMDAIKTSARAVWKNLGGVVGLIVVNFVLMFLGYLALCIGLYFVIPIMIAGNAVAYRKVFPAPNERNFNPPSPQFYQGI